MPFPGQRRYLVSANSSNLRSSAIYPHGADPEFLQAHLKRVQNLLETPERRTHDVGEDEKVCVFVVG